MVPRIWLFLLVLCFGLPALAQTTADNARLISDSLQIADENNLIAEGNVEIFYQGQTLTASRVVYNQETDRLQIEGPIVLSDGSSSTILASQGEMSADLTEGVLRSARLVMAQQMQIASSTLQRVSGRYTAMNSVIASSCKVCATSSTPLWELRAKRVVHDQQEQLLYFEQAQLRFGGVPVFYIPRLRMPDPTLDRATGFLRPSLSSSTNFGTGLRLPYFIKIGDSRDLTVTPFIASSSTRTVELTYRQAFKTGTLTVTGAVSQDDLLPGETRAYAFADGSFSLPQGFNLTLHGEIVSDKAYLLDYGYSDSDRLDSSVVISRTKRDEYISARLIEYYSLRNDDYNDTLPSMQADATYTHRFALGELGGTGKYQLQTHAHTRTSTVTTDSTTDSDSIADGRDMSRVSLSGDWRKSHTLNNGMELAVLGEASADFYKITQDATYGGSYTRLYGSVATELRWPWVKASSNGTSQLLEPIVQVVTTSQDDGDIPNEDSALVEFDEGNLFALSRFPGSDAVETGSRINLGFNYLRTDPNGWTLAITAGRVFRSDDPNVFSAGSGLDGTSSDWLAAWQLDVKNIALTNRLLFDDAFNFTKAELATTYTLDKVSLTAGYVHTDADVSEDRDDPISELTLASAFKFNDQWSGELGSRYDFESQKTAKASAGLTFRNECLLVDLSLSRRFTSSTTVDASTDFGLTVELLGFGGGSTAGKASQCRQ